MSLHWHYLGTQKCNHKPFHCSKSAPHTPGRRKWWGGGSGVPDGLRRVTEISKCTSLPPQSYPESQKSTQVQRWLLRGHVYVPTLEPVEGDINLYLKFSNIKFIQESFHGMDSNLLEKQMRTFLRLHYIARWWRTCSVPTELVLGKIFYLFLWVDGHWTSTSWECWWYVLIHWWHKRCLILTLFCSSCPANALFDQSHSWM